MGPRSSLISAIISRSKQDVSNEQWQSVQHLAKPDNPPDQGLKGNNVEREDMLSLAAG